MGIPLFIREWIVISGLIWIGTAFFYMFLEEKESLKWGSLLFLIVTAAYFSRKFLYFIPLLFIIIQFYLSKKSDIDRAAYYLMLLPIIPIKYFYQIPFPGLQQFFPLTYPRLLNILILLPLFFKLFFQHKKSFFSSKYEKCIVLYFLYVFIIGFRDMTFTGAFRHGFLIFIDYFLLYYVLSHCVSRKEDFEKLSKSMIFVSVILGFLGIFEVVKQWHLYNAMFTDAEKGLFGYAYRLGILRAQGTFAPIPFGGYFFLMSAITILYYHLSKSPTRKRYLTIMPILFVALLCTVSRGPLVAYAIFIGVFLFLKKSKIFKMLPITVAILAVISITPLGRGIIASLPFVGKAEQGSVQYRKKLLKNSIQVIKRYPVWGNVDFKKEPEMEELRSHGGRLIDVVNSYLQVVLEYGLVGLILFLSIFLTVLSALKRKFFFSGDPGYRIIGKLFFSAVIAWAVMVFTVSMVTFLPIYTWLLFGLSAGYANINSDKFA